MLFGCSVVTFDSGGQVRIPPPFRSSLGKTLYITQGFDRNLLLLPENTFAELVSQINKLNMADPLSRLLLRLIAGNAHVSQPEDSWLISLPSQLSAFAQISHSAVMVGQGEFLEIWSPEIWAEQELQLQDAALNVNRFAELNLTPNGKSR